MVGQVIGKTMPFGYAGSYSRQPDTIIDTHPLGGSASIPFGAAVKMSSGAAVQIGAGDSAPDFAGIALREVKSARDYMNQNVGYYAAGDAVPVLKRGCANIYVQRGTPAYDGAVYVRISSSASYPTCVVGGFEASSDTTNTIELSNVKFRGAADANGIAEVRILEPLHA